MEKTETFKKIFQGYNKQLGAICMDFLSHKNPLTAMEQAEDAYKSALFVASCLEDGLKKPATTLLNNIAQSFAWDVQEIEDGANPESYFRDKNGGYLEDNNTLWGCWDE